VFFVVYARIYGQAFVSALAAIGRNPWTLVLPMALAIAFLMLAKLLGGLGIVGGFILSLSMSAGCSIYTYFVSQVVARQRVGLSELRTSIGAYFWTWINLFFVLWIIQLILGPMSVTPEGRQLQSAIMMIVLVVLNAAPEIIYLKGASGGLEVIQRSLTFLQECWIEWFLPNVLILAGAWLLITGRVPLSVLPYPSITVPVLLGALLHVVMVFRGFLFQSLDGSTHRQRMYKFRGKV